MEELEYWGRCTRAQAVLSPKTPPPIMIISEGILRGSHHVEIILHSFRNYHYRWRCFGAQHGLCSRARMRLVSTEAPCPFGTAGAASRIVMEELEYWGRCTRAPYTRLVTAAREKWQDVSHDGWGGEGRYHDAKLLLSEILRLERVFARLCELFQVLQTFLQITINVAFRPRLLWTRAAFCVPTMQSSRTPGW
jgi:hypothetical protein